MATTEQIQQIERLVPRMMKLSNGSRKREYRDRFDNMTARLLKAKEADADIAAQEIEHAVMIVGR